MSGDDPSTLSGVSSQHVAMAAVGILALLFAMIPQTRPLVFVGVWLLAPVVAFGSLILVFRGRLELRSARGIVFAMSCAAVAFLAVPLGYLIASPTIGEIVTFTGFLAAIVAIGFAKLSVSSDASWGDREVPPPEAFENVEFDPEDVSREKIEELAADSASGDGGDAFDPEHRDS